MKVRTVTLNLEVKSDVPINHLRKMKGVVYIDDQYVGEVEQIQVNVIKRED